jgi:hypothetical protein
MYIDGFQYRRIDEKEFDLAQKQWDDLLELSDANSLFVCWEWMHGWWKTWSTTLDLQLHIYFIYHQGVLVGILPLYLFNKNKSIFREFQFLGNAWGRYPTIRSEHISPLFNRGLAKELNQSFLLWIRNHQFLDCFIIADCTRYEFSETNVTIRKIDKGYVLNCEGDFEAYKRSLSSAVRLKVFNRVDYLVEKYRSVEFGIYDLSATDLNYFFDQLNNFHINRWGAPCFNQSAVDFHKDFILRSDSSASLLSFMKIDNQLVSLSYNLYSQGVLYNIQSGYVESFDKKVALGALHFGFLIEYVFSQPHIKKLDFLAGRGKRSNYKASFRGDEILFFTVQIFASFFVGCIYKVWMRLRTVISMWRAKWITL